MADNGWISGERIAIDGTKLKAYTGWDMVRLDKQLAAAQAQLEGWLHRVAINDLHDEIDEGDDAIGDEPVDNESQIMKQIARLTEKIRRLEGLKEELDRQDTTRISPADPEARLMKSARGGKYPAYNLQTAV